VVNASGDSAALAGSEVTMFRSVSYSKVLGFCLFVGSAAASATGCLVSNDGDRATGGKGGTGAAGMPGAGTAGMPASTCDLSAQPIACIGTLAPENGVVMDVTTYKTDGKWGTGTLTGGTSLYKDDANAAQVKLTSTLVDGAVHLVGTIPAMGYAGAVYWLSTCTDASAFGGLSVTVGGTPGGSVLQLQVQTNGNYPISPSDSKGACDFLDCATKWSECVPPMTSIPVTDTQVKNDLTWSSFTGGLPNAAITPNDLVGLQFQLECQADVDCVVDVAISGINFLPL
jgi:hypothetical protein